MAAGWERWRAEMEVSSAPVRAWLIRELAPQPGETVLELSAGAGDTGFDIAALLGDEGRLISTDFAAEMVEVARRRGGDLGLTNVEYRVVDAERIGLDDDSVDGVVCRYGYMLMGDPAAAFAEPAALSAPAPSGARSLRRTGAQPVRLSGSSAPRRARAHAASAPGAPGTFALANPVAAAAARRAGRVHEPAHRGGRGQLQLLERRRVHAMGEITEGALAMVIRSLPRRRSPCSPGSSKKPSLPLPATRAMSSPASHFVPSPSETFDVCGRCVVAASNEPDA